MVSKLLRLLLAAAAIAFAAAAAKAEDVTAGSLTISGAWAAPTMLGRSEGAVYFTIANTGSEPDTLLSAKTDAADRAELHAHIMSGDVMRMRKVDSLTVPAGGTLPFEPGGYHVMLSGLKHQLVAGGEVPLTLRFQRAGEVQVTAKIEPLAEHVGGEPGQGR